ncbi:MAG: cation:proton antiporter, partial [Hymenobacteraceae bacterium]|nr:cation:proton antiporter [Hymenobacteraceae bacterium]MDX5395784.1 cation:proton antiporter [Hymenobacteraceae bacterium]MDX5511839.1 cation:proton antiporter [Hymenobacteraceae bacterium]
KSLMRFYDGIAWLMQILMFLTLGLLVFPKQIVPIIGLGFLIAFFLIMVARPVGVFLSLAFFKFPVRDKILISWVGLRGAAPIVFATYPLLAGVEKANLIFNLVFFMVLTSVMLQGTTISLAAKWLRLVEEEPKKLKHPMELELSDEMRNELFEITLNESSPAAGKPIVDLGLPKNSLIVLINRSGKYITPNGSTELETGDKLMIMVDDTEGVKEVEKVLGVA